MISTGVMNRKEFKKKSYMLFKSKNASLQKINEKEWDEPDSYSTYLKRDRFIMQNRKLDYSDEYNDETHSQQPTYFGLHSKIGGDYLGRDTMANMFRDVHGAVKRMGLQDREHEFRHSFLKPGQTTILKPGESYEHATRKLDRQEKEFPKKSQFPKLTEGEIRKLINDWFGMISHIPSIFADDVEEGPSYWEGPKLPWSKDLIYVKNGKQNKK